MIQNFKTALFKLREQRVDPSVEMLRISIRGWVVLFERRVARKRRQNQGERKLQASLAWFWATMIDNSMWFASAHHLFLLLFLKASTSNPFLPTVNTHLALFEVSKASEYVVSPLSSNCKVTKTFSLGWNFHLLSMPFKFSNTICTFSSVATGMKNLRCTTSYYPFSPCGSGLKMSNLDSDTLGPCQCWGGNYSVEISKPSMWAWGSSRVSSLIQMLVGRRQQEVRNEDSVTIRGVINIPSTGVNIRNA